ncbi:MAG TPA: glycoside hydrolase family 27 protein, partial [Candidatus Acidoferrales bacterium]|nr:glycoside hydrolase family 27 protein [Candidatus Acidoferrales bacterium]
IGYRNQLAFRAFAILEGAFCFHGNRFWFRMPPAIAFLSLRRRKLHMRMSRISSAAFLCLVFSIPCIAQQTGLAPVPPMGWNSWNHFAGRIDDQIVRQQADAMVSSGMKAAGYQYIVIDDTWAGQRDAQGFIHPNDKFPDMKALADYVHSKGLKLGIYSSPAAKTCAGYEGSRGHEDQDAQTYASWGIDYLKYDWCQSGGTVEQMKAAYTKMHEALLKTGRPIVFSLCQYGWHKVWEWGASVGGNLWRTTGDIRDNYFAMAAIGFDQNGLEKFAGPGHWNDPDMLEVGNGGMSEDEYRTHMSLWAILAAPLMAGNDLSQMTPYTVQLLTNPEVIAVDQDPLGAQGYRVTQEGPFEVWMKPMADGSKVVGLFNRQYTTEQMAVSFPQIGVSGQATVRDLWLHKDLGTFSNSYSAYVPRHGVVLVRIKAK